MYVLKAFNIKTSKNASDYIARKIIIYQRNNFVFAEVAIINYQQNVSLAKQKDPKINFVVI